MRSPSPYGFLPAAFQLPFNLFCFIGAVCIALAFPFWPAHASGSIAITPDGATVFVVNPDSGSVSAIDTASETKLDELVIGRDPRMLALGPDGQQLYVTNQASATLTILDIYPLAMHAALRVGPDPYGVVAAPNGRLVYVAASGADRIDVVDTERVQVVDTIPVQARPKGLGYFQRWHSAVRHPFSVGRRLGA